MAENDQLDEVGLPLDPDERRRATKLLRRYGYTPGPSWRPRLPTQTPQRFMDLADDVWPDRR